MALRVVSLRCPPMLLGRGLGRPAHSPPERDHHVVGGWLRHPDDPRPAPCTHSLDTREGDPAIPERMKRSRRDCACASAEPANST
jgi:hypothetical protein